MGQDGLVLSILVLLVFLLVTLDSVFYKAKMWLDEQDEKKIATWSHRQSKE